MRKFAFVLANALTGARAVFSPCIAVLAYFGNTSWALFIACILASSDFFDGKLVRWSRIDSRLGPRLDPIADAILCTFLLVALVIVYQFSILVTAYTIAVCAYFFYDASQARLIRAKKRIRSPNRYAKLKMSALMTGLLLALASGMSSEHFPILATNSGIALGMATVFGLWSREEYRMAHSYWEFVYPTQKERTELRRMAQQVPKKSAP